MCLLGVERQHVAYHTENLEKLYQVRDGRLHVKTSYPISEFHCQPRKQV